MSMEDVMIVLCLMAVQPRANTANNPFPSPPLALPPPTQIEFLPCQPCLQSEFTAP
jgi:hypothetical protein